MPLFWAWPWPPGQAKLKEEVLLKQKFNDLKKLQALIRYLEQEQGPVLQKTLTDLNALLRLAQDHRTNCLISRTVATSVSGTGIVLAITGAILAPFTFGISLGFSVTGGLMATGGAVTTLVTDAVDSSKTKGDLDSLKETIASACGILEEFPHLYDDVLRVFGGNDEEDEGAIKSIPTFLRYFETWRQVKLSAFHSGDEEVEEKDLKEGDHIFRPSYYNADVFHHGICVSKDGTLGVVDFGQKEDKASRSGSTRSDNEVTTSQFAWKSLPEFCSHGCQLYRRNYLCPLSVEDTCDRALQAEKHLSDFCGEYNLFSNNCEHFATFCKLGKSRCDQWAKWARVGKTTASVTQKAGVALKITGTALRIAEVTGTVAKVAGTTSMVAGSILGPLTLGLDIFLLVTDYQRERPNIANVEVAIKKFQDMTEDLRAAVGELKMMRKELLRSAV